MNRLMKAVLVVLSVAVFQVTDLHAQAARRAFRPLMFSRPDTTNTMMPYLNANGLPYWPWIYYNGNQLTPFTLNINGSTISPYMLQAGLPPQYYAAAANTVALSQYQFANPYMTSPYMLSTSTYGGALNYSYMPAYSSLSYRSPYGSYAYSGYSYGGGGYGGGYGGYGGGYMNPSMYGDYSVSYYGDYYGNYGRKRYRYEDTPYESSYSAVPGKSKEMFYQEKPLPTVPNASLADILSGKALNAVLADLVQLGAKADKVASRTFAIPLTETGLNHINVTRGSGSVASIKNGALKWPDALKDPEFTAERERVDRLVSTGVEQARAKGRVDGVVSSQIEAAAGKLRKDIKRLVANVSAPGYIDANIFLTNLVDVARAFQGHDVGNYFTGAYSLHVKTLPELVKFMSSNKLQFAKALPEDEEAYTSLYQALAGYDYAVRTEGAPTRY